MSPDGTYTQIGVEVPETQGLKGEMTVNVVTTAP